MGSRTRSVPSWKENAAEAIATVIAERVGWTRGMTVLNERVRELRPVYLPHLIRRDARPMMLARLRSATCGFRSRRRIMTLSQALATPVDEIMESMALAPRNGFIWSRDAACAETTSCARRSMICWQAVQATR